MFKKYIIIFVIFFSVCSFNNKAFANNFSDLTIVVSSCDKYSNLWDPFFKLLFKNWQGLEESKIEILLISNKKNYPNPRITSVAIPNEKSWSDNMLETLKAVKTKYVMILLEDYFITKFDEKRLMDTFNYMKNSRAPYLQISYDGMCPKNPSAVHEGVRQKEKHEQYRTSLQAAIWDVEMLKHILKSGESAWSVEIEASTRSEGFPVPFLAVFENYPLEYLNMTQDGMVNYNNLQQAEKLGVVVNTDGMKVDNDNKLAVWYKRQFKHYIYWQILVPLGNFFSQTLRRIF